MKQFVIRIAKTAIAGMALFSTGAALAADIHRFDERHDVRLDVHQIVPGSIDSMGINSKDSRVYSNLAKVAEIALRKNKLPFVDSSVAGKSVPSEEIIEDFSAYCLDSDFTDKVAWRRERGDSLWLQFSCLKDGEYPAIRERLFVIRVSADYAKPVASNLQTNWSLIDLRLLSANIEPGSKLELKSNSESRMKSSVARAAVAISGAVLLSTFVANREMPGQQDKKLHSGVSAILAAGAASYFHFVQDMSPEKSALAGGAVSLLIGGGKEVLDPTWGGNRSKEDMKANLIGAALGSVTLYLSFKFN